MGKKIGIIKVRVWLPVVPENIVKRHQDASFTPTPEFRDAIETEEQKFREPIMTFINDAVGLHNWTANFFQFDDTGKVFECRIKCDTVENYRKMAGIISEKITHVNIREYFYLGTV